MVEKDKIKPIALAEYLEDANASLFETDFIGAELYRSEDGGSSWKPHTTKPLNKCTLRMATIFPMSAACQKMQIRSI